MPREDKLKRKRQTACIQGNFDLRHITAIALYYKEYEPSKISSQGTLLSEIVETMYALMVRSNQAVEIPTFSQALDLWGEVFPKGNPNKGGVGRENLLRELSKEMGGPSEGLSERELKALEESLEKGKEPENGK